MVVLVVFLERRRLCTAVATRTAHVRLLPRVNANVANKVAWVGKALAAVLTLVWSVAGMRTLMQ